ncbi:MAG: FGGY family carbohydrate kinase [bacterium]
MSLMGLDVGTTGVKAMAFTPEGKVLARAHREYPELYPRPGWVQMNPDEIWRSTKEVISEVGKKVRGLEIGEVLENYTLLNLKRKIHRLAYLD